MDKIYTNMIFKLVSLLLLTHVVSCNQEEKELTGDKFKKSIVAGFVDNDFLEDKCSAYVKTSKQVKLYLPYSGSNIPDSKYLENLIIYNKKLPLGERMTSEAMKSVEQCLVLSTVLPLGNIWPHRGPKSVSVDQLSKLSSASSQWKPGAEKEFCPSLIDQVEIVNPKKGKMSYELEENDKYLGWGDYKSSVRGTKYEFFLTILSSIKLHGEKLEKVDDFTRVMQECAEFYRPKLDMNLLKQMNLDVEQDGEAPLKSQDENVPSIQDTNPAAIQKDPQAVLQYLMKNHPEDFARFTQQNFQYGQGNEQSSSATSWHHPTEAFSSHSGTSTASGMTQSSHSAYSGNHNQQSHSSIDMSSAYRPANLGQTAALSLPVFGPQLPNLGQPSSEGHVGLRAQLEKSLPPLTQINLPGLGTAMVNTQDIMRIIDSQTSRESTSMHQAMKDQNFQFNQSPGGNMIPQGLAGSSLGNINQSQNYLPKAVMSPLNVQQSLSGHNSNFASRESETSMRSNARSDSTHMTADGQSILGGATATTSSTIGPYPNSPFSTLASSSLESSLPSSMVFSQVNANFDNCSAYRATQAHEQMIANLLVQARARLAELHSRASSYQNCRCNGAQNVHFA